MTIDNQSSSARPTWNGLPGVAIRKIFGQLKVCDRARFMVVSKSWKRILTRDDLPAVSERPWPIDPGSSRFNSDSYLTLIHFVDPPRTHRFELPKFHGDVAGGWFCGSSSGWLVIASGPKLDPDMFLWNPLSGAVMKLPPLSALSFLTQLLKSGADVYNISSYIKRVQVSSPERVVAVVFSDPDDDDDDDGKQDYLALCTPEDKEWRVLEPDHFYSFSDILFHDGKLCVLAKHIMYHKDKRRKAKYMISLSRCQVQVNVLCLDYKVENSRGDVKSLYNEVKKPLFNVTYDDQIREHLVEFSGELLVMAAVYDLYAYNSNGDGPVKPFRCQQIQRIEVRKVDGLERIESFLRGQNIVLADTGSFAFSNNGEGAQNGIFFTSDYARGLVGDDDDDDDDKEQCIVREFGVFYPENSAMHGYHAEYIKHPAQCRTGWLTPKFF